MNLNWMNDWLNESIHWLADWRNYVYNYMSMENCILNEWIFYRKAKTEKNHTYETICLYKKINSHTHDFYSFKIFNLTSQIL